MKIVFAGTGWYPIVGEIQSRLSPGAEVVVARQDQPLEAQMSEAEVLLPSNGGARASVIAAAPKLRLIQQPAVGFDGIDLAAAKERGIPVCNAPGTNPDSVAQAALLLILALARRVRAASAAFARAEIGGPLGRELNGKRLLLIGHGASAVRVARAAEAMEMSVVFTDSKTSRETLFEHLREADFVSIHCPLNDRTRGLIGREAFAAMKPRAALINCARGPIVDRAALEAALVEGKLGGVGLDTYWREPWDPNDPLFAHPDVIALPHVAGSTHEAFARIATIVSENIRRLANGEPLLNRIV